ncbi:MAG: UDP-4-amino-4,6-dideoxy-N-acetyl-beta-L-altrosamine transaminase [Deltaproteobacteria bacterium]|nr:UDP-4-amino-4,6-dideoxy-N-acetyl-beta-L-altrosamine transaminase [Deltaproteobacteria bacterium]
MAKISYSRQTIEHDDIAAIVDSVNSGWLTQGFHVETFEEAIKEYCGSKYAVVCCNGTAALHLAYLALGIGKDDAIITSPITFAATSNAALYVEARPYFSDIDPDTRNIDPSKISNFKLQIANCKAIVPVHFAGLPCDMEAIENIAKKNNLLIIEDACHALGAGWVDKNNKLQKVGNCSHSDATVFSFHPVKSITTGEGGAITTNNKNLYERLKMLRSHGITKEPEKFINKDLAFATHDPCLKPTGAGPRPTTLDPNQWYYEMHELGFNYRLTDIQCALGISQLKKLDRFTKRRHEIASMYDKLLKDHPHIKLPVCKEGVYSAHHLYSVEISFDKIGIARNEFFKSMAKKDIHLQVHYIPVHLQPYYQKRFGFKNNDFPAAEAYYKRAVSLPIYPLLTDKDVHYIVECMINELKV